MVSLPFCSSQRTSSCQYMTFTWMNLIFTDIDLAGVTAIDSNSKHFVCLFTQIWLSAWFYCWLSLCLFTQILLSACFYCVLSLCLFTQIWLSACFYCGLSLCKSVYSCINLSYLQLFLAPSVLSLLSLLQLTILLDHLRITHIGALNPLIYSEYPHRFKLPSHAVICLIMIRFNSQAT